MAATPPIAEAFRQLQAGNAVAALEIARRVVASEPGNARAHLAQGIALRMGGRLDEARALLERATTLAPSDHAAAYELGVVCQLQGHGGQALAQFERARGLQPGFFAAQYAAGMGQLARGDWEAAARRLREALAAQPGQVDAQLRLADALRLAGRHEAAGEAFVAALASHPDEVRVLTAFGQYAASRGDFKRAASLFGEALRVDPRDEALPIIVAQVELLLGRWREAWEGYRRREPRMVFSRLLAAAGQEYRVPALAELEGRDVTLVAEQGLGDVLFFLRWAAWLRPRCRALRVAEQPRLHSLLARTGHFEGFSRGVSAESLAGTIPLLVGDLPSLFEADPFTVPPLRAAPLPAKLEQWRAALAAAGPAPWIGVTWRAGSPAHLIAHGLRKEAPVDLLFAALAPLPGTVVAFQRGIEPAELAAAGRAVGRPVHDFSAAAAEPEDALALCALLDRHVGVSSTNMHLADLAGATADVLVPFPPEWRWRVEGASPWFPGFRVHRQGLDGQWAFEKLASDTGFASSGRQ